MLHVILLFDHDTGWKWVRSGVIDDESIHVELQCRERRGSGDTSRHMAGHVKDECRAKGMLAAASRTSWVLHMIWSQSCGVASILITKQHSLMSLPPDCQTWLWAAQQSSPRVPRPELTPVVTLELKGVPVTPVALQQTRRHAPRLNRQLAVDLVVDISFLKSTRSCEWHSQGCSNFTIDSGLGNGQGQDGENVSFLPRGQAGVSCLVVKRSR